MRTPDGLPSHQSKGVSLSGPRRTFLAAIAVAATGFAGLTACTEQTAGSPGGSDPAAADRSREEGAAQEDGAAQAVNALDAEIGALNKDFGRAFWIAATFPSPDAQSVAAAVEAMLQETHIGGLARIERRFGRAAHQGRHGRKLMHLGHRFPHPMPADAQAREALTRKVADFEEAYGEIEVCFEGQCYSPIDAERRIRESEETAERIALWTGLREETAGLAGDFRGLAEDLNAAARAWGYDSMGDWLRSRYELPGAAWTDALEQLTADLEPLARPLRCHVAASLGEDGDVIPATALRSLWGRDWTHLHGAVRAGLPPYAPLELTVAERFDTIEDMVRWGESTYRSAGFPPLPDGFWEGSQFTQPDREISACPRFGTNADWHKDVRLTMCGEFTREDLLWSQGILAFLYYDLAFADQDWVFRDPPHLGFHFANSDAMGLALTPEYLQQEGLLGALPAEDERLSRMLHDALRILPRIGYGIAVDRWRAEAFDGPAPEGDLNARWRGLRAAHQGVTTPQSLPQGSVEAFAHILVARNVELLPGALGEALMFQFYKEACDSAGHEGPLHTCSFYGSAAVAERLWPVLAKGASAPWYEVLESYTDTPDMSAQPLLEYFAPLSAWLEAQNAGRSCR